MFEPYLTPSPEMGAAVEAVRELQAAQDYFDRAEPEEIDEAIHRLTAAELRSTRLLRELKLKERKERGILLCNV